MNIWIIFFQSKIWILTWIFRTCFQEWKLNCYETWRYKNIFWGSTGLHLDCLRIFPTIIKHGSFQNSFSRNIFLRTKSGFLKIFLSRTKLGLFKKCFWSFKNQQSHLRVISRELYGMFSLDFQRILKRTFKEYFLDCPWLLM